MGDDFIRLDACGCGPHGARGDPKLPPIPFRSLESRELADVILCRSLAAWRDPNARWSQILQQRPITEIEKPKGA